ncbi:MAG TPA: DUF4365 domain-containing protein [Sedimentisphaerales bacterium]|nr:DUF4365 domain-containing protein [Sedimentisphaerales bacterium]
MREKRRYKQITPKQITGQRGVNLVEQIVLEMGFVWHPTNASLESGIDGIIEIRDPATGETTNNIIQVQVKATEEEWISDTPESFVYRCKARDIDYWMRSNTPVILIAVSPNRREAYWTNVKEVFSDSTKRNEKKVVFDKATRRFSASAALDLMKVAVHKDIGPYLPATEHEETLYSNLLEVETFPRSIYSAATDYRSPEEIFDWSKKGRVNLPSGWLLTEKMVRSVYDLREEPWTQICDRGSVEEFGTDEWSDSDDPDIQREFVRLMNQTLRADMHIRHLWYSKEEQCFFFPARWSDSGEPKSWKYHYESLRTWTSREVVSCHRNPETARVAYYRHNAMRADFLRINNKWYLAIIPHYVYTIDGKTIYPYAEDLLSGIKRIERQNAVFGQTIMWKHKLTFTPYSTFFGDHSNEKPLIVFGHLLKLKSGQGLDDESWLRDDILIEEESDGWGLFQ